MGRLNIQERQLCEVQGKIFAKAAEGGYDCNKFVKDFMNSSVAECLDKVYDHMQWAGKAYVLDALKDEIGGFDKAGVLYSTDCMYWIGYIYRYWHYYTGESSKVIYSQANIKKMATVYLGYHTLSVSMAIDRLKENII